MAGSKIAINKSRLKGVENFIFFGKISSGGWGCRLKELKMKFPRERSALELLLGTSDAKCGNLSISFTHFVSVVPLNFNYRHLLNLANTHFGREMLLAELCIG